MISRILIMPLLYSSYDPSDAVLLAGLLREEGCRIHLEIPMNNEKDNGHWAISRVYCMQEDVEQAMPVLDRFLHQKNTNENLPDLLCRKCGEENPGNFELCWNCEADLAREPYR